MDRKPKSFSMMLALASFAGAWGLLAFSMTRAEARTSCADLYYQCTFRCALDAVDVDGCMEKCAKWWRNGCGGKMPTGVLQLQQKLPPASILGDGPTFQSQGPAATGNRS